MREKTLLVYGIAILLGILTGLVGSCFQLAISVTNNLLTLLIGYGSRHHIAQGLLSAILSMVMVLIAWIIVRDFAPEASGSGVQEIEGALLHERPVHWRRLLPIKFIGGVLAISAKMVVGREGPTIQMGGNLGAMLGEIFRLKQGRSDTLISAGAAAGLATAFNAPLAGVLFVIEEMRNEFNFNFTNFKMVAICCVIATTTMQMILGSAPAIPMVVFDAPGLNSLWLFFLFGIVTGFVGLVFNKVLMHRLYMTDKFSPAYRFFYVALIGALAGFLAVYYPDIVGGGYEIIQDSLTLSPGIGVLSAVFLIRFLATILCYTTNVPGGIFAPMLALGTLFGMGYFYVLNAVIPGFTIHPGMFAVAGMGALFSATIRSPLTGIVLVVEMTQNYSLILPLMVSCLTSTTVVQLAKNPPVYTQLLRRTLRNQKKVKI
ncbi:MAG: H(+)/Cl(-) exchange transporter ClcA [Legionella sp.]|nr:H(+)/Cl(-) exchange transporter ClcA [Legionella sp.]